MALVLVTSCFVGGTFAKYVTNGTGNDSARVAKFGVKVTVDGSTFANTYAADDTNVTLTAGSVVSTDKVVAPGTNGKMAGVIITGTPEVAVRVSHEAEFTVKNWNYKNEAVDGSPTVFYCPVEIKVGNETIKGLSFETAQEFQDAVISSVKTHSKVYEAGTDLNTNAEKLEISWAWAFEDKATDAKQTDEKDTYLGDQAVAEGKAATISLTVTTTVTQID